MENKTLIDLIEHDMQTDDEDREKQSDYLKAEYESCSIEQKAAINKIFIALCGWSLEKIIVREQGLNSQK